MRAKLLVLFLLMSILDAGGKIVERDPAALARIRQFEDRVGLHVRARMGRSGNNLDIFRGSSRHLLAGTDLYAEYPAEHRDRFKYSPTFAALFTPFAALPWGLALLLWQLVNALALFYALTRVLDGASADFAIAIVLLECWRSMQNVQSNSLVAASILLAFSALEHERSRRAAAWIGLGAAIKIFPLVAGVFALPDRRRWRHVAWIAAACLVAVLLPLAVTSPSLLAQQYRSWFALERVDAAAHMQSVMGLLRFVPGLPAVPNLAIQLAGLGLLLWPLAARPGAWHDRSFRLQMLSLVLLFVVLFNPQAERASYVIAFTGVAVWYVSAARGWREHALFGLAMLAIPVASLFIPGRWIRSPEVTVVRLVIPCLLIWARIQVLMLSPRRAPDAYTQSGAADPRRSPSAA